MDKPTEMVANLRDEANYLINDPSRAGFITRFAQKFVDLDTWMSEGGYLPAQWCLEQPVPRGRPRRETDGPVILAGYPHGSRSTYNRGCRCLECTRANREAGAKARMRAQVKLVQGEG